MSLNKLKKLKRAILLGLATCIFTTSAYAMPEIMPLMDVEPGMNGVAYTVVDGSKELKSMDVNVIGTIGDNLSKGNSPRILAEVSGPVAEAAGGVLSGMSGSPVYVDGKLVGALSATLKEMSPYRVLITPIEQMLSIWEMPDRLNQRKFQKVDYAKIKKDQEQAEKRSQEAYNKKEHNLAKLHGREISEEEEAMLLVELPEEKDADEVVDENTPEEPAEDGEAKEHNDEIGENGDDTASEEEHKMVFNIGGFSGRDFDFLKENLNDYGIVVKNTQGLNISGNNKVIYDATLEPGSPVGVAAVIGDFSVGAVGTVTAVDGKRILAFGHPFVHRGNVNFFMTDADVIGTAAGPTNGMKIAESTSLIGRINQDRDSGISGILGNFPQSVPVIVNVKDKDLGTEVKYSAAVAYNEELMPALTTSVAYAAMSKSVDRLVGSTADFQFAIRTDAAENRKFERRNLFYSNEDVGKQAISEMTEIMKLLCADREREVDIQEIRVDVSIDSERKTAAIVSATPDKTEAVPGETINLKVVLKPYRKENDTIMVPYTIPKFQKLGNMRLDVHGGALISVAQIMALQQQAAAEAEANEGKVITTAEKLRECNETYMNNEIIVEPTTMLITSEKEEKKAIKEAVKLSKQIEKMRAEGKVSDSELQRRPISRFTTPFLIENGVHATIKVVKEHKPVKEEKSAKKGSK